jgi:hypothetical protein
VDTHSQVEFLRLHCEHLRTLLDKLIIELANMKHELAMGGTPSFTLLATHLNGLEKQGEKIQAEAVRLQSFLHSLEPQSTATVEAAGESLQVSPSTSDTAKMGRYKIVCTLDGTEPAILLYEKYADQEKRTFSNSQHAILLHDYLSKRAGRMRWDSGTPIFNIVPAGE